MEETLEPMRLQSGSDICYKQRLYLDKTLEQTSGSLSSKSVMRHFAKDTEALSSKNRTCQGKQDCSIMGVVERFLAGFQNKNLSSIVDELQGPLLSLDILEGRCYKPAEQAFQCCKSMAFQAKEQLRHTNFTRFIALCFFLIWQALTCEPGKAGARVVCVLETR